MCRYLSRNAASAAHEGACLFYEPKSLLSGGMSAEESTLNLQAL